MSTLQNHPAPRVDLGNLADATRHKTINVSSIDSPITQSGHRRIFVLDGIRALMVMMVIAVHTMLLPQQALRPLHALMDWGSTGVDGFFVLSGFLITGILYDAKNSRRFFRNFYARRALRILPSYYAWVIFAILIAPLVAPPIIHFLFGPVMYAGQTTWTYWVYLANFSIGNAHPPYGILDSAWSLAVEEQYYLVWPLLVFLLTRKQLMAACVGLMGAALATRIVLVHHGADQFFIFTNTFCRMDCLAAGSLLALACRGPRGWDALGRPCAILCSAGAVAIIWVIYKHQWRLYWDGSPGLTLGYSAIAVTYAGALGLLIISKPTNLLHRFFTTRFMRLYGRSSYAIYLWHGPVVHALSRLFTRDMTLPLHGPPGVAGSFWTIMVVPNRIVPIFGSYAVGQIAFYVACVLGSLVVGLISWHVLESHFLALNRYFIDAKAKSPPPVLSNFPAADRVALAMTPAGNGASEIKV